MDNAYNPEAWKEFYIMLGGSIAALTGLLFVATSLHVDEIGKTPHFTVRAFGNTFELVGQLIASALVLVPQSVMWLGIELTLLNTLLFFVIQVRFHVTWHRAQASVGLVRSTLGAIGGLLGGSWRRKPDWSVWRRALPGRSWHLNPDLGSRLERV